MAEKLSTYFAQAFEARQRPSGFFTNLCKKIHTLSGKVELQTRTIKNIISVDVQKGTGARYHDLSGYDTVEYEIPLYNDAEKIPETFFDEQQFGETKYTYNAAKLVNRISNGQGIFSDAQRRAEQKQVADGILTGKVTLVGGDAIEYKKDATHDITPTNKWASADATIATDVAKACKLSRIDGKHGSKTFNLLLNGDDVNSVITNPEIQKLAKSLDGISRVAIGMPEEKTPGGTLEGVFATNDNIIYVWSNSETFTIPEGYGFDNEGQEASYLPQGRAILLPANCSSLEFYYGGVVRPKPGADPLTLKPEDVEQLAWQYATTIGGCTIFEYGVKSRPLFVPRNIDEIVTFSGI